ncbi:MAG: ribonuclease P protein component [Gammaproteobacteria bacterium]|jgi:ribonuclease P protein component|nr:ribonuclease P protein component [Gammaproteobacteria bacterium]MDP6974508.1 ribonuclease P protein component [Gammaproteobacteria bacterium]|tara:strand:+ start:29 stop:367 length:339 start_codon:yes stop_codon:yes gene_type:complete
MSLKFPQSMRITKAIEYARIFKQGTHSHGKFWQIISTPSENKNSSLGLAISKKIHKRAVDRNLFKRIAREAFRLNQDNLKGVNIVVMTKNYTKVDNRILATDLQSLFYKVSQ